MKAVVMAGGEGTRLRPLTSNQPKPMVSIVGKPCMEHILELLARHGFVDVIVTVAFLPQAIRSYFGDGSSLGFTMVTDKGTLWPRVIFWVGFALAAAALVGYLWKARREDSTTRSSSSPATRCATST